MFIGSYQSRSELTFTDEGAEDNGPSGAHTLLSSAPACGASEGQEGNTMKHQSPSSRNPPTVF